MANDQLTLNSIALGPHKTASQDDPQPVGDLDAIQGELEALQLRLVGVAGRLAHLYGPGLQRGLAAAPTEGKIPRLQSVVSDMSDALSEIEHTVERL